MKKIKFQISIFMFLMIWSCSNLRKDQAADSSDHYTCPMHPTVIRSEPGSCPVCGMDLVKKEKPHESGKITPDLNYQLKPVNGTVISSIRTTMPVRKTLNVVTQANGIITYDTRRVTTIPIRFGGRIEKLLIRYNFQPVQKGQKILEIYSPELLTTQRDLLYLMRSDKDNDQLIAASRKKLKLLGISDPEINQLITSGKESYAFSVYSPVDGYIVEETATRAQTLTETADGSMAAGESVAKQTGMPRSNKELLTREGMYVNAGQIIFKVVNTDMVWAEFDLYQHDAAVLKAGDSIQIKLDDARIIDATINFTQPFLQSEERFSRIRVYLPNTKNRMRIGQLAIALFDKPSAESLWIPLSARMDLGNQEIVFTKRNGVFQPRRIVTSRESDGWIEVLNGLVLTDSLAYRAQFMVDSEGFVRVGN